MYLYTTFLRNALFRSDRGRDVLNQEKSHLVSHLFGVTFKTGFQVKFWVESVEIFAVQMILDDPETFPEALVVDDLPLTEKADRITDFRIFDKSQNIVVSGACFLFGSHVFMEVRDRIAF